MADLLVNYWEAILSRQTERIQTVYRALSPEEQQTVRQHLRRMASEPDWHPAQRVSAEKALRVLEDETE
jgi:hypothetical protein